MTFEPTTVECEVSLNIFNRLIPRPFPRMCYVDSSNKRIFFLE